MKPIHEVLKAKELELQRLQHEIDVLRQAFRLIQDDSGIPSVGVTVHPGVGRGNSSESVSVTANTSVSAAPESNRDPDDKDAKKFPGGI